MTRHKVRANKSGDWSYCPACGGSIDTGYECNRCGRDWLEYNATRRTLLDKHTAALREMKQRVWEEAANQFENNWDGADPMFGHPTYLAWLRAQAQAEEQP